MDDEWEEVPKKRTTSKTASKERDWLGASATESSFDSLLSKGQERGKSKRELEREEEEKRKLEIRKEREIKVIETSAKKRFEFGDKGSNWRMTKLKRVFQTAEEEGVSVEQVALDRYGSLEAFQEALDEKKYLDEKFGTNSSSTQASGKERSVYRAAIKKSQFKAPDGPNRSSMNEKQKREREDSVQSTSQSIPKASTAIVTKLVSSETVLTKDQLNKLFSKVLKARIMKSPNLDELEEEYEYEKRRSEMQQEVVILPTISSDGAVQPLANSPDSRGTKKLRTETHDDQGNRISYLDESKKTLEDLVREEKTNKKSHLDSDIAHQISKDSTYKDNLDYLDDQTEKFSRRKRDDSERQKQRAIKDHKRTEAMLHSCNFCYKEDIPPSVSMIAIGLKTYLALPETVDMVPYHCMIVPIQHTTSSLELEDDVWDEIRNFQKCLIRMFEAKKMGVLFMEQVMSIKKKQHTFIECIPVPYSVYEDAPAYFKEALLSVEGEWTQHKPIINTERGFRKSMVKDLPYFHIWFDPNRGYGHVIEDSREWPVWFGKEIIASALDLPPDLWRRPKNIDPNDMASRSRRFIEAWDAFDWTRMLYE